MRFLRLKPRRIEALKNSANEEEDEEGRQGLLPLSYKNEQSSAHLHSTKLASADQAASQTMHITLPPLAAPFINSVLPASSIKQPKLEQGAVCTSQIVVLKAPLHCQGCARRVKKNLSKLQGVQTHHVDMEQQKVTVIGNICPDNVLQCVNKVIKGAQLWAAPSKPSTSPQQFPR